MKAACKVRVYLISLLSRRKLACLTIVLHLFGCVSNSTTALSQKDLAQIKAQKSAVVLFNVKTWLDKKLLNPTSKLWKFGMPKDPPRIRLEQISSEEESSVADEQILSFPSWKAGWRYFVLPRKDYKFSIDTPYPQEEKKYFRLRIPKNKPLVYAGDMEIHCDSLGEYKEEPSFDTQRCSLSLKSSPGNLQSAKKIAAKTFPNIGPLEVVKMRNFDAPLIEGLSQEELAAIRTKKASIVLYRIKSGLVGDRLQAVKTGGTKIDSSPTHKDKTPTERLDKEGWRYFVLSPGPYRFFWNIPEGEEANRKPILRLLVPQNTSVLYAGFVECGWSWCNLTVDETKLAENVAKFAFPGQGLLKTRLMHPYDSPISKQELLDIQPISISVSGIENLVPPEIKHYQETSKAAEHLPKWNPWISGGGGSGEGAIGLLLIQAAILGVWGSHLLIGSVVGTAKAMEFQKKMEKCLQVVGEGSREFGSISTLQGRLYERLSAIGVVSSESISPHQQSLKRMSKGESPAALNIEIQKFQLLPTELDSDHFTMNISVRAKLLNAKSKEEVFTNEFEITPTINIKAHCQEGRVDSIKKEFAKVMDSIVDHILTKAEGK